MVSGRWSNSDRQILGRERAKMRCIPILSAGITRQPIMIQAWLGTLWRAAPKCRGLTGLLRTLLWRLGFLSSPSSGRGVTPLGFDMGQAGVPMRFISTIRQRAINHWATWFLAGHHQALAMRGRYRMGIGYRQQPHGTIHHLGMGVDLIILSFSRL